MFKNYLKIAFRNIFKQKHISFINIVGFGFGIACSLLILFYLQNELSYEKHIPEVNNIFRLTNEGLDEGAFHWAVVSPLHGLEIQKDIPEIEAVGRLAGLRNCVLNHSLEGKETIRFKETNGFYSDPKILDIFDVKFIRGSRKDALSEINTIILTESLAKKYFANEDPIGKTITNETNRQELEVIGVVEDSPATTHFSFDYLVSMETFYQFMRDVGASDWLESKGWAYFYTYVKLTNNFSSEQVSNKLLTFTENFYMSDDDTPAEIHQQVKLHLQPISDIHLQSNLEQEMNANSNIIYIYVFALIMILVILIASVNFINLTTARSFNRMKEVGIRKIVGAEKRHLIIQFLFESLILTCFASIFSIIIMELVQPLYNNITGLNMTTSTIFSLKNIVYILATTIVVGVLSGIYPAFFISKFKLIKALKGIKDPASSVNIMRKGLVIFQFVISVFMIFSSIIVVKQMEFFQSKELGFDKDQLVGIEIYGDLRSNTINNYKTIGKEFQDISGVSEVTFVSNLPGDRLSIEDINPEGLPEEIDIPGVRYYRVDENFLSTMGIELLEGIDFSERTSDTPAFIINETLAEYMEGNNVIGYQATNFRETKGEIIGIVKDFNFASLHQKIEPLVLEFNPRWASYAIVKLDGKEIHSVMNDLRKKFDEISPGSLFNYTFINEKLDTLYKSEQRLNSIFKVFSLLAMIISCMGLFGLSIYYAELRTKEVGVRKVLGASVFNIVTILTSQFIVWVTIANIIALSIGFLLMKKWLDNFAYKISISPMYFVYSIIFSFLIALITVSFHAIKSANANPVKALKYE